jgi:hypothetical protein
LPLFARRRVVERIDVWLLVRFENVSLRSRSTWKPLLLDPEYFDRQKFAISCDRLTAARGPFSVIAEFQFDALNELPPSLSS